MEDCKDIKLKRGDKIMDGQIWYEYVSDDSDMLILHIKTDGIMLSATAHDCFSALIDVRNQLEEINIYPLIMGAHQKVYPSPMQQSMGDGRTAYLQRMGNPALQSDCVDIFDPCNVDDVSSIAAQEQYHNRWIADARDRYRELHP